METSNRNGIGEEEACRQNRNLAIEKMEFNFEINDSVEVKTRWQLKFKSEGKCC